MFQGKEESHISVNQKLEMMMLHKEGMSKAESGRPLGLLPQIISQVVNAKKGKGFEGNQVLLQ